MTRWWWVRHGPTHRKTMVGHLDVPADLSDTAAIARLDGYLPRGALLLSSDLIRARDTVLAVAKGRDPLRQHVALREIDFGAWDGLDFAAITALAPDHARRFWEEPGDIAPPGGESWNAVAARVNRLVDEINSAYPGRDIVAVAHSGVILTQVQRATNSTAYAALGHKIDNLSVTDMAWDGASWQIGRINHLP